MIFIELIKFIGLDDHKYFQQSIKQEYMQTYERSTTSQCLNVIFITKM